VFPPGSWLRLRMYYACPACGLVFGRENGYFTGAMIVSYVLGLPLLGAIALIIAAISGWSAELVLLAAGVYFVPFAPGLFRSSRVIWMHVDRVVDPDPESERYITPRHNV